MPPARKVLARPGPEPGSSVYMTDALPTELLTMPAEMRKSTLTEGSQAARHGIFAYKFGQPVYYES